MNHTKKIFTSLAAVFISAIVYGQSGTPFSEMYLKGKYTAACAMEVIDHATIRNCELCPFVIDPNNKSRAETKDIEMTFTNDSLTLNQNGKITTVPYVRNKDNHSFSFTLDKKAYSFRVFFNSSQSIIEDSNGLLMVLEKVK